MTQFIFLQLFDKTFSRYAQINESSSGVNACTDSCVETLIPELMISCTNVTPYPLGTNNQKK